VAKNSEVIGKPPQLGRTYYRRASAVREDLPYKDTQEDENHTEGKETTLANM